MSGEMSTGSWPSGRIQFGGRLFMSGISRALSIPYDLSFCSEVS